MKFNVLLKSIDIKPYVAVMEKVPCILSFRANNCLFITQNCNSTVPHLYWLVDTTWLGASLHC